MRHLLTLCVLLGAGVGLAQSAASHTASHTVGVSIPAVLRLSVDGSAYSQTQSVALQVEVAGGGYRVTPGNTSLTIFANTAWQLFASFKGDDLALTWRLDGRSARLRSFPQVLMGGGAGGWRTLSVHYGLAQLPADGRYQGLVTYTLTRP